MPYDLDLFIIPLLNIPLAYVMGGVCGGISSLLVHQRFSRVDVVRSIVVGGLVAGYATQSVTSVATKVLDRMGYSVCGLDDIVGFALGLCGITVAETGIFLAKRWRDEKANGGDVSPRH
jgi:hypothetical protein